MKPGQTFTHKHWMDESGAKLLCKVTAVRNGAIYYRPIYKNEGGAISLGTASYFPIKAASRYVEAVSVA